MSGVVHSVPSMSKTMPSNRMPGFLVRSSRGDSKGAKLWRALCGLFLLITATIGVEQYLFGRLKVLLA